MNFLRRLFGLAESPVTPPVPMPPPSKTMRCPFCDSLIVSPVGHPEPAACTACKAPVPHEYRAEHASAPALFVPVIGYRDHGKTNYLLALMWMLGKSYLFWPNARLQTLSKETTRRLLEVQFMMGTRLKSTEGADNQPSSPTTEMMEETDDTKLGSQIAPPTTEMTQRAYIMKLNSLGAGWGDRTLVIRDFAGEHFNPLKFLIPEAQLTFLRGRPRSKVIFMFSLGAKPAAGPTSLQHYTQPDQLIDMYAGTLWEKGDIDIRSGGEQRIGIVVLSKADTIPDLPPHLEEYVKKDPLWKIVEAGKPDTLDSQAMELYFEKMDRVSREIEAWLMTCPVSAPSGPTLVAALGQRSMTQDRNTLRFCLVTLGADPRDKPPQPRRILDPFFWAMRL